jgi:SAM-dependent methyltransferase
MTTDSHTSYDEVPYESKPLFSTHPDCLGAAARLRGIPAPLPSECRVLELGCAAGGNLIPMAYGLPRSRFVGVDLSQRQIADGQQVCRQLELPNIDLRAASIADIDASWGAFDYIICHGVYSWVPPSIQEKILWVCRNLLAPTGVAYVSYNTYPGWHMRTVIRDLMKYHSARFDDPRTKVQQARSIVSFIAQASNVTDSPMSRCLAEEAEALPKAADFYLYHEHLEDTNQPLYFHEFVRRARDAGLEYLGEAWHHTQIDNLPPEVQEGLQAISADLIDLEQFVDFIRGRTFRRTLVCHAETHFVQTPGPEVLEPMFVAALARPESANPDIHSDQPEGFRLENGTTATTNLPIFKAALMELYDQWPAAVPFPELFERVVCKVDVPTQGQAAARAMLAAWLVRGYLAHVVAIHCEPFPFRLEVSPRPRTSKLARLYSLERSRVPSLRHWVAELSPAERVILRLTDGTRGVEQIAAEAENSLKTSEPAAAAGISDWKTLTEQCLQRFARWALLEA